MHEELRSKLETAEVDAQVGEWLKANGTLDVPEPWGARIDRDQSLAWNIQKCFHSSKESARKTSGTRARLEDVERELVELRARGPGAFAGRREREEKDGAANLLSRADAKGRRIKVGGDLEVYIGKSAADNLALLRRAQSFDYWLHLRDQPGSHAILRRTRGRLVTDAEFIQAGRWVVEQSLGKRASELKGERHDLLIVECRFVKPIKGDRLGRVNYTNDRVLRIGF